MSAAAQAVEKAVKDTSVKKPVGGKSGKSQPVVKSATAGLKANPGKQMTINSERSRLVVRLGLQLFLLQSKHGSGVVQNVQVTTDMTREAERLLARIEHREQA